MCGINGILRLRSDAPPVDPDVALRTRDAMATRGPDGEGFWVAPDGAIALGHRRLAIIDLSETGAQPMTYDGGRYRLVFKRRNLQLQRASRGGLSETALCRVHERQRGDPRSVRS
jgi:hypothetical protein